MNIKKISVGLIDVEDRLRSLRPIYVSEIARSFEEGGGEDGGQITAIEVRDANEAGRYRLISGAHRLAAAIELGWGTISASVQRCTNDEALLREIDENLVRHDLSDLDRARFLAERESVWASMNPLSVPGRAGAAARWHAANNLFFASDAAQRLGVTPKTIRVWMGLARATASLTGELRDIVSASYLANRQSELVALCKIEDAEVRGAVVRALLSEKDGRPTKVAQALALVTEVLPEQVSREQKQYDALVARWVRTTPKAQGMFLKYLSREAKKKSGSAKARVAA